MNANYTEINAAAEENDPNSVLNYFRKMVQVRKNNPVLVYGEYELVQPEHPQVYAYTRTLDDQKMLVLLNFSTDSFLFELPGSMAVSEEIIDNYDSAQINGNSVSLKPYQAVILHVR